MPGVAPGVDVGEHALLGPPGLPKAQQMIGQEVLGHARAPWEVTVGRAELCRHGEETGNWKPVGRLPGRAECGVESAGWAVLRPVAPRVGECGRCYRHGEFTLVGPHCAPGFSPSGLLSLLWMQAVDSILPLGEYFFPEILFSAWGELGLPGHVPSPQVKLFPFVSPGGFSAYRQFC